MDINKLCLNKTLDTYEFINIHQSMFPYELILKYHLQKNLHNW